MEITNRGMKGLLLAVLAILLIIIVLVFVFNLLLLILPVVILIFALGYVSRLFHPERRDELKKIYKDIKFKVK